MCGKKILRDGHIHSPYCPHGTKDSFSKYIEKAIARGLLEMTFTEHMPFSEAFMEPEILAYCAPSEDTIQAYFKELKQIKIAYQDKIKINIGLEVDYIEGHEEGIKHKLDAYGDFLDDGILSVHFVKIEDEYYCVDESPEAFGKIADRLGSIEAVYDLYFETIIKAIQSNLGQFKPRRIGHPTLVRIFNQVYPINYTNKDLLERVVKSLKENDYEIDFNTAGLRKPYCKEIYPSGLFEELIRKYEVRKVYGSDAHQAIDVGRDFIG